MLRETQLLKALLKTLQCRTGPKRPMRVGIGDDAAVAFPHPDAGWVATSDMLVEDIDFRWSWASASDVGIKAAAVNLSDLAAMGAAPEALLISIALPAGSNHKKLIEVVAAAHRFGAAWGAPVVGGDISRTQGGWVIAVTALGRQLAPPLLRHRAQVGDIVAVTTPLGAAAAGLCILENKSHATPTAKTKQRLVQAQKRPKPHLRLGQALAHARMVRSAADISDGLHKDVTHLLRRGQGVCMDATRLPLAPGICEVACGCAAKKSRVKKIHRQMGAQPCKHTLHMAVCGGEDFGLVIALAPENIRRAQDVARREQHEIWPVGRVISTAGVHYWGAPTDFVQRTAFDHFAK